MCPPAYAPILHDWKMSPVSFALLFLANWFWNFLCAPLPPCTGSHSTDLGLSPASSLGRRSNIWLCYCPVSSRYFFCNTMSPSEDSSVKSTVAPTQDSAADSDSPGDTLCIHPVASPAMHTVSDAVDPEKGPSQAQPDPPFSVFSQAQKILIVFIAALTTLIPPLTASIYYPVITQLAGDLHVSITDINLTITTYLVRTEPPPPNTHTLRSERKRECEGEKGRRRKKEMQNISY